MNAFFDTPQLLQQLEFYADQLIDTPFVPHAMIPGAGMDCIGVNAWCYLKIGFFAHFAPPSYSIDEGKHAQRSKIVDWLEHSGRFAKVDQAQPGDTLCFQFRQRVPFHVGLKLAADKFVHVLEKRWVERASIHDYTYARSLRAIYRPLKGGVG